MMPCTFSIEPVAREMTVTRRQFLRSGALAASTLLLPRGAQSRMRAAPPPLSALDPTTLKPFVDALPIPATARASGRRTLESAGPAALPYYRIEMNRFESRVHRNLGLTEFWGYAGTFPGPTIEAQSGEGFLIEWVNDLPAKHLLQIDPTLHGAEAEFPEVRAVVHAHGAKAPPESDGYPEAWFVPGKSALYHYPNAQDAATLWYHDHALGITRLNVYAGLLGAFLVRDDAEAALNLPSGECDIPLIMCDRMFERNGRLSYPVSPPPANPWASEFFGSAILVNGKLFPYLDVKQRKYRFRVINASNSRFYHLMLSNGQAFQQIASDQGLLAAPVSLKTLSVAPGERADLVVDFSARGGEEIVLNNDAYTVMQFRVARGVEMDRSTVPSTLRAVPKIAEASAIKTRTLTLDEMDNMVGDPVTMLLNQSHWCAPITEDPVLDSTEIWNLVNLTDDAHPIHLHLVRFQILDRRRFDTSLYQMRRTLRYTGHAVVPEPGEAGWKDTVRADPGMVTRIIVKFSGYPGRYVWHCHILEHEDNEMMRPYNLVAAS
ncbi:MAG TPA: multicopper oxidase domain-containing protein [Rhodanobacteraceae bacterium]|jgi:spore coat protein A|nr:multicopper oxidase domain-containing protein [Rhodanobacteraceae bacterium]